MTRSQPWGGDEFGDENRIFLSSDIVHGDKINLSGSGSIGKIVNQGSSDDLKAILTRLANLEEMLPHLGLSAAQRTAVEAEIEAARSQPDRHILKRLAESVRAIVEGAAGDLLAAYITRAFPN